MSFHRFVRLPALFLSALLQLAPLVRVVSSDAVAVLSPLMAVLRWAVGAAAVAGSYHTVSGATTITVTQGANTVVAKSDIPRNGIVDIVLPVTNGVPVGYRFNIQVSVPATSNPASYSMTGAPPGLAMAANTGVLSGTATAQPGLVDIKVTRWRNRPPGSQQDITSGHYKDVFLKLRVLDAGPVITTDPVSQTVNAGEVVSLSVVATGAGLTYRWIRNDIELPLVVPGATNATLTFDPATVDDAGSYKVRVTNSGGSVLSAVAELVVNAGGSAPVIASQSPATVAVHEGERARLFVDATGAGPLTYQWQRNNVPLPDQAATEVILEPASVTHNGTYVAMVSNSSGATPSAAIDLVVKPLTAAMPEITDTSVTLRFSAIGGRTYRLETSADLLAGWTAAGTTTAADENGSFVIAVNPGPQFFRILAE